MKERPILFSAPMVRAILAAGKTMTRRVLKPQPESGWRRTGDVREDAVFYLPGSEAKTHSPTMMPVRNPYGVPGDRLWVREAWRTQKGYDHAPPSEVPNGAFLWFEADGQAPDPTNGRYRHARFMCRWMSRTLLDVTGVRVERLQDMHHKSGEFLAEGIVMPAHELYPEINTSDKLERYFVKLWDRINAKRAPWASNPWVWVIEFKVSK